MKVLISGGGTGGHIYPALAIAQKIEKEIEGTKVLYVGTKRGLEAQVVPSRGYDFETLDIQGFKRKIDIDNVKRLFKALKAVGDAKKIIRKFKPDVIIGTGGYVCGPVLMAGALMKIPTLIHEQNAFPGITNKILSRFVDKILISFDEAASYFKDGSKVALTGNPVRDEFLNLDRVSIRNSMGIGKDESVVLSVGGSGGARTLNNSMQKLIGDFDSKDMRLVHVTGKAHYESFINSFENNDFGNNQVLEYIDDMPKYIGASDLVVCSAGAITIAEITAAGIPSIVVPKAYTAENHQEYNAKNVEKHGAGICILERELSYELLKEKIFGLLNDKKGLSDMADSSKEMGKPDAIDKIYNEIQSLLSERK